MGIGSCQDGDSDRRGSGFLPRHELLEYGHQGCAIWAGRLGDIKICLFAYYGHPVTGVDWRDLDYAYTPTTFGIASHIALAPRPGLYSVSIDLFYTVDEVREVVALRTTRGFDDEFTIDRTAMDYLYKLTSAHPGMVAAMVDILFNVCTVLSQEVNGFSFMLASCKLI